ncbi:hypothetical protein GOP47_0008173 [Adiantum capillus-veneris]|uniref:RRM domain-containing protein n=1 Tax=Adiantum capillus-veneris TaxID=13818 RepID=A0A9D4UY22_ADICA|nr:hypothetical protein GOP47_0008173 [Adiantum capillus-veneris]
MSSSAGQPQFRYAHPPSKVLHLRNLPWECTHEELVELCKPFGKVVNTKCNVGANRNQAFVEFEDLNQAISMVSYYASSSEPAQIRGKTVYLQYSNRQEVVNNKSSGDVASNVLLVTFEGVEAGDVSIDVLHLVFSAFGFVHKIATFEKTAGFQALVQFSDADTAAAARTALDGRSIPRYLLPDHVGSCHLHISFSAHVDLTVKFQSHRSRDYTNPLLPVAASAIDCSSQFALGPDGKKKEPESNVLLASIENMQYEVTIDVLHAIFSAFGTVEKIAMFEKNAGLQALIQFSDVATAVTAKGALEGHCIYEGGFCKLHLAYSRHTDLIVKANNDRSRDYTNPNPGFYQSQPSVLGPQQLPGVQPSPSTDSNFSVSAQRIGSLPQQQSWERPSLPQGGPAPSAMYRPPYSHPEPMVSSGTVPPYQGFPSYSPGPLPADSIHSAFPGQRADTSYQYGQPPPPNPSFQPFGHQYQSTYVPGPGTLPPNGGSPAYM